MYIVLDLDDCILNITEEVSLVKFLRNKLDAPGMFVNRSRFLDISLEMSGITFNIAGYSRPYLREFLEICTRRFKVAVWSAGSYEYVHACVKELFHNLPPPIAVLTGNDKVDIPGTRDYHKPLSKFFELVPDANDTNTVLIDDKRSNFYSYPNNGITIPPFYVNHSDPTSTDDALPKVLKWLLDNKGTKNIKLVDKTKIFTQELQYVEDKIEANHLTRIPIRILSDKIRIVVC